MARYIHENKVYDTEKSELVLKIEFLGIVELYKSNKGNWFKVCTNPLGSIKIYPTSEEGAKYFIAVRNDIEVYEKYFGKLEEA